MVRADLAFLFILRVITMVRYDCSGVFSVRVRRFQIALMSSKKDLGTLPKSA